MWRRCTDRARSSRVTLAELLLHLGDARVDVVGEEPALVVAAGGFCEFAAAPRQEGSRLAVQSGGDAFLESTPPVLTFYQARAGQRLVLALDPARIRAYSRAQQQRLVTLLAERGIAARGGGEDHGAFVVVTSPNAAGWSEALAARGVVTDARGSCLRLCPDVLTRDDELVRAADELAALGR